MATSWKTSYFRYKDLFLNVSNLYKKRSDLRAFLEIILSLAAVIIFVVFALKPTALTIISLFKQIKAEEKTLSSLTQKVSDLQKVNMLLSQNQSYLDNINVAIPTVASPETFVKQIEGISSRNNLTLMSITINDVTIVGNIKMIKTSSAVSPLPKDANEMAYSINVRGTFSDIDNFIKNMENLRVISQIDSISINSTSTSDSGNTVVAIITGREPFIGQN